MRALIGILDRRVWRWEDKAVGRQPIATYGYCLPNLPTGLDRVSALPTMDIGMWRKYLVWTHLLHDGSIPSHVNLTSVSLLELKVKRAQGGSQWRFVRRAGNLSHDLMQPASRVLAPTQTGQPSSPEIRPFPNSKNHPRQSLELRRNAVLKPSSLRTPNFVWVECKLRNATKSVRGTSSSINPISPS